MITNANRAAPVTRVGSMLGPRAARRGSTTSVHATMQEYSRVSSMQASHEFQEDLIGHPQEKQNSMRMLNRKTHSFMKARLLQSSIRYPHVVKEGAIKKLTSHQQWVDKTMKLTEESLTISDADASADFIPLHEITDVTLSQNGLSRAVGELEENEGAGGVAEKRGIGFAGLTSKIRGQNGGKQPVQQSQVFDVFTTHDGRNSGRTYTFMAESSEAGEEWIQLLLTKSRERIKFVRQQTKLDEWRETARDIYNSWLMQMLVAFLIFANFAINAVQAEFHPKTMTSNDTAEAQTYFTLDVVLTVLFIAELVFNGFGHWFWPFVLDAWNWFDGFIVLLSLISILVPAVPGLNILRVLRAFRLLRLIRRFRSLKKIFDALILSIIPVLNAFLIGVLITMIYTIIGVFLFSEESYENFGSFNRSLHTLFMLIATGDWPAEDIQPFDRDGNINKVAFAYLFSFVAIVLWTCIQVVVAVLLDNFLSVTQEEKRAEAIAAELATAKHHMMDPLLQKLVDNFESEEDLKRDIIAVFKIVDVDNSGAITNQEMLEGFAKLQLTPRIRLSPDDCKAIKEHSLGLINDEELDAGMFEQMMRWQLHSFIQRRMHDAFVNNEDPSVVAILAGLKLVLAQQAPAERGSEDRMQDSENIDRRLAAIQKEQLATNFKVTKIEEKVDNVAKQVQAMHQLMEQSLASLSGPQLAWPSIQPFRATPGVFPANTTTNAAHASSFRQNQAPASEPQREAVPSYLESFDLQRFAGSPLDSFGFVRHWVNPPSEMPPASSNAQHPPARAPSHADTLHRASSIESHAAPNPAILGDEDDFDAATHPDWARGEKGKGGGEAKGEGGVESPSGSGSGSATRKQREKFQVVDTEWLQMAHDRVGKLAGLGQGTKKRDSQEEAAPGQARVGVEMVMVNTAEA